jgi:hypothetical protein
MTIRSSDVIPPSRYWLAVIAVMVFPLLRVSLWISFWGGALRTLKDSRLRSTPRTKMRLCTTGRRQKVESGALMFLILNQKQNPAGPPGEARQPNETHSELASFSNTSINQAAD